MNKLALAPLVRTIIGPVPPPHTAAVRGAITGIILFFIFEYLSQVNSNIPRVPVSWLLMVATVMMESVLFFRIARLLRQPRHNDLFFILRLNYRMRTVIGRNATRHAHMAFIPFTAAALVAALILEFTFMRERSLILLFVLPVAAVSVMGIIEFVYATIIVHGIPCTHSDRIDDDAVQHGGGILHQHIARHSVHVARRITGMLPYGLRCATMRNCLYLLRGEVILSVLIIIAAPVVLYPLLLVLHNPQSPFVTLFPLVLVFMINSHFSSELAETAANLIECHWYRFTPGQLLRGFFVTLALPSAPLIVVLTIVLFPTLTTLYGVVRLFNFCAAFAATLFIGSRNCMTLQDNDRDPAISMAVFAVIAIGNFVPWAGIFFSVAAAAVLILLDWEIFTGKTAIGGSAVSADENGHEHS